MIVYPRLRQESQTNEVLGGPVFKEVVLECVSFYTF